MKRFGFYRVGCAVPEVRVADCTYNKNTMIELIKKAQKKNVDILLFPELSITGYTCGDLFFQNLLLSKSEEAVKEIAAFLEDKEITVVLGVPVKVSGRIYNCAAVINKGKILGIVPKIFIPEYNEFYEKRWFSSGKDLEENRPIEYAGQEMLMGNNILFCDAADREFIFGIEICEDLWVPIPPSSRHALNGAALILNLSASNDLVGKREYRAELVKQQSARCVASYAYASSGFGESTTDVVYGGDAMISENGTILTESERFLFQSQLIYADVDNEKLINDRMKKHSTFRSANNANNEKYDFVEFASGQDKQEIQRTFPKFPFVPSKNSDRNKRCEEIFNIQVTALAKRITHTSTKALVVGISGGLDSTLALLACVKTCDKMGIDRTMIKAITMPGFGTTDRTYNNAIELTKRLKVSLEEISIKAAVMQHFKDIGHDPDLHNVTYENSQARERTQILMDIANRDAGLVVGTGDLSELALGWATYNGDHMSMYGINSGIPKTLVRYLVKWIADNSLKDVKDILYDVLDTPVSPELLPPDKEGNIAQKTEEVVGPYELLDFFLYYMVRFGFRPEKIYRIAQISFKGEYDKETIYKWLRKFYVRFISQQFKRSCLPDGPKVGSINLSPRGDWRMPSDASMSLWLEELDSMIK
ncbi:MAG: NAD(+) synthase [Eubacteriaceae bacterium]|nr:NAD(+) synthase [Eubacteriaceae bacterium]